MECERCHKEFDKLVTRQGFSMTYFVEWTCAKCYKDLQGEEFEIKGELVEATAREQDEQ